MDPSSSSSSQYHSHQPHHFQQQHQQQTLPLGRSLIGDHHDHPHHLSLQMSTTSSSSAANSTASFSPSSYRSLEEADQIVPDPTALAFASAARHHFHHHPSSSVNGAVGLSPNSALTSSAFNSSSSRSHSIWSPKYSHHSTEVSDTS